MSVCCSVDYYGANASSETGTIQPYDLACPNVCNNGKLNFWKSRCLERIGNPEIKTCYKGCQESVKHPELKAKMDAAIKEFNENKKEIDAKEELYNKEYNRIRYQKNIDNTKKRPRLNIEKRAEIITLYVNEYSIAESVKTTGCNKSLISMYRRLYREGAMDREGNILI